MEGGEDGLLASASSVVKDGRNDDDTSAAEWSDDGYSGNDLTATAAASSSGVHSVSSTPRKGGNSDDWNSAEIEGGGEGPLSSSSRSLLKYETAEGGSGSGNSSTLKTQGGTVRFDLPNTEEDHIGSQRQRTTEKRFEFKVMVPEATISDHLVAFTLQITHGEEKWKVLRRYSSLLALHKLLLASFSGMYFVFFLICFLALRFVLLAASSALFGAKPHRYTIHPHSGG